MLERCYAQGWNFTEPADGSDSMGRESTLNSAVSALFPRIIAALEERRDLSDADMRAFMEELLAGRCGEAETAAFLIGLRAKGETGAELAAAAAVLRKYMTPFDCGGQDVLDTCGTGGDGASTFNISTAAALVAAGAGVPVVKHGNRAMSSRSGSADVLAVLEVNVNGDLAGAQRCFERAGIAFCFAPAFHPALARVAAVRRQLRVRTLFNCLGPLANPAQAPYQLIGVGAADLLDPMAAALASVGCRRAFLVRGHDGLDEVSLSAPTMVREVWGGEVRKHEWSPRDFGLAECSVEDLHAEGPQESAAIIRGVLANEEGPARRIVVANAAVGLLAAERVADLKEGVALADNALTSGAARHVLELLVTHSRESGQAS